MKEIKRTELIIKKSKFINYLYEIDTKEEVKNIWESLKKEHKKASHIPYACIIGNTASKSDDKEPSGTSGNPIYLVMQRNHLTHHAIFVVRYFGGLKLGSGGLIRAYKASAMTVLQGK